MSNKEKTNDNSQEQEHNPEDLKHFKNKSKSFTPELEKKIQELELQLEKAQKEAKESKETALRYRADAENTRQRAIKDIEKAHKFSVEKLAREILNVVDSLEMGLNSVKEKHESIEAVVHGVELTHKLLLDTLSKFDIRVIDPIGDDFDPNQHEAMTMQESAEYAPNKVIAVLQKGFTLHDRILRPARVIVSRAAEK